MLFENYQEPTINSNINRDGGISGAATSTLSNLNA